jgi:hypothetical protein
LCNATAETGRFFHRFVRARCPAARYYRPRLPDERDPPGARLLPRGVTGDDWIDQLDLVEIVALLGSEGSSPRRRPSACVRADGRSAAVRRRLPDAARGTYGLDRHHAVAAGGGRPERAQGRPGFPTRREGF